MMANQPQDFNDEPEKQWKLIYTIGGISTLLFLLMTFFDIIIGSSLGVDITTIPQSATGRFKQFQENWLLGLYYLDLLNLMNQIILIPSFFALYAAHRNVKNAYSTLA
ncbi:hypothetical protein JW964_27390 [candidate division KSB1 bacterium]|nr:hypothetical protein [candidate division KSB1 bacterium]